MVTLSVEFCHSLALMNISTTIRTVLNWTALHGLIAAKGRLIILQQIDEHELREIYIVDLIELLNAYMAEGLPVRPLSTVVIPCLVVCRRVWTLLGMIMPRMAVNPSTFSLNADSPLPQLDWMAGFLHGEMVLGGVTGGTLNVKVRRRCNPGCICPYNRFHPFFVASLRLPTFGISRGQQLGRQLIPSACWFML